jgi:outer membrane protein assembly factor BamB
MKVMQANLKSFAILIAVFFSVHMLIAQSPTPKVKWFYNTFDFSAGMAAAKDFDGDGKYEVTFGCYRYDSSIYALNAENGSLLWKYNASVVGSHGCNDVAPIIYDVDNNGTQEVIVPSSCNPKTYCFNGSNGSLKWVCNTKGSDSPPTIADIDNDGKPEILHGEFGGWVICINAEDGSIAWEIKVDGNSWIQTAPTIVDLDNNGVLDFVVASWNFNFKDSVFAYRGDNQTRMWAYPIHDHIYHGTAVSDLDLDGKPELVIGSYNDTLYCINGENGTTNWKYASPGSISGPASLGDIDNDGSCDVVFCGGTQITALTGAGSLKWAYPVPNGGFTFRGAALADITNDSYLDVIFGTYNTGVLYALNGNNGSQIWNLDLRAHHGNPQFGLNHAPLVADFDGDDTLDVFVVGGYGINPPSSNNFGRAYMIKAGKGSGPNWLMFQRDVWRQSSLCMSTPNAINEENLDSGTAIYPNPSNGKFTIELKYDSDICITNTIGQIVFRESLMNGKHNIELSKQPNGIYFLKASNSNSKQVHKLIKE